MVTDPISDLLIRIKNGYRAALSEVVVPWSRTKEAVSRVMVEEGYLESVSRRDMDMLLKLKYTGRTAAVTDLRRISRPGRRIYSSVKQLPKVSSGAGVNIISTPKGVVSDKTAKKLNVGGEILAQIW